MVVVPEVAELVAMVVGVLTRVAAASLGWRPEAHTWVIVVLEGVGVLLAAEGVRLQVVAAVVKEVQLEAQDLLGVVQVVGHVDVCDKGQLVRGLHDHGRNGMRRNGIGMACLMAVFTVHHGMTWC